MPRILLIVALSVCCIQQADAQRMKFFRNQVDADRGKSYLLTNQQGPWLILCASFNGENGLKQANDLVYELRSKHRLDAYIYRKEFDYSGKIKGLGFSATETTKDRQGQTRPKAVKMKAANDVRVSEVAVVVGNFASLSDGNTQKTLKKIKTLRPRALEVSDTVETNQSLGYIREEYRNRSNIKELRNLGPMRQAMVIANPLLPEEYFSRQTVDRTILKLNKDLTYSLLKNRQPYSVRVASFRGESTLGANKSAATDDRRNFDVMNLGNNKKKNSKLAIAAAKAHRLTQELRKVGVEAYEFHDRHESYVCVGGFEWVSKKRNDGKDEMNPNVARIIESYRATVVNFGEHKGLIQPRSLPKLRHLGIVFDVQPVPVAVPKSR